MDTSHRLWRKLLLALTWAGSPLLWATPAKFDIAAQPADTALESFSRQSGTEVMYNQADLSRKTATEVRGEMEPAAALEQLLAGTGYTHRQNGSGKFLVTAIASVRAGTIQGEIREEKSGRPVHGAHVQVAGTDRFASTDRRGRFSFENVPAGSYNLLVAAEGMQNTQVTDIELAAGSRLSLSPISVPVAPSGTVQLEPYSVRAKKSEVIELDPYSVEGRKEKPFTMNMDITRTINDVQPYYIFDAATIERSGTQNIADFLKQNLTMNATAMTNGQSGGNVLVGNASTVNLRGLGTDKTLVLVNGRRLPGVQLTTTENQPDLNGIPLSSIERIEVMPSSSSGIYGGSALGGVVNVILKQNYSGGEARVRYDNTWGTDAPQRTASLSYGFSLEQGRTQVMLSANWGDSIPLLFGDRSELITAGFTRILKTTPSFFYNQTFSPFQGSLPNISGTSTVAQILTLKDGRSLGSGITHLSAGIGPGTSMAALSDSLLANAGTYDLNPPPTLQSGGLLRPLGVSPINRAYRVSVKRKMASWFEVFTEASYNQNYSLSYQLPQSSYAVDPSAAVSPFNQRVNVKVPVIGQPARLTSDSVNSSFTIGAILHLPRTWTAELDFTGSQNELQNQQDLFDTNAITADANLGVINPFVDTLRYPLDLTKYRYVQSPHSKSTVSDLTLRATGPMNVLPWGAIHLASSLEHLIGKSGENEYSIILPVTTSQSFRLLTLPRRQVTDSGYLEASVPLIKRARWPLVQSLDFQSSVRVDRYTVDTGTTSATTRLSTGVTSYSGTTLNGQPYYSQATYTSTNFTTGVKYEPISGMALRVSNATAFLPPTPTQLIKNPLIDTTLSSITDPKNGNASYQVQTISGGNPDLKPQNSESLNAGIIWEVRSGLMNGLRLNAEYYWIRQFDAISTLAAQNIVSDEGSYPGRVQRDSTGRITLVDRSSLNLYERSTEGWDFSVNYRKKTDLGTFSLRYAETIILHLKQRTALTQPSREYLGFPTAGGALKTKLNGSLMWERKNWFASWTARYFGPYAVSGSPGDPNGTTSQTIVLAHGGALTVPSQVYHDVVVSYDFGGSAESGRTWRALSSRLLAGVALQVGVQNVFGTLPPLDAYYTDNYYLSPYGDRRLRNYTLSLKKRFECVHRR